MRRSSGCALVGLLAGALLATTGFGVRPASAQSKPKKSFAADRGPASLDVQTFPREQRARYAIFATRCGRCHTLARPINTNLSASGWKRYVKKMMNKPDSGIAPRQGKEIYLFLKWYQRRKDAARSGSAGAPPVATGGATAAAPATPKLAPKPAPELTPKPAPKPAPAGATTAPRSAAAPRSLAALVPARTLSYLEVADWQTLERAMEKTRAKAVWGELAPFFADLWKELAPVRGQFEQKLKRELGLELRDVFAGLRGGVSVALIDVDARRGMPHLVAQIDLRGREAAFEHILAAMKKAAGPPRDGGPKPIVHQGATIESAGRPPVFFTRSPGVLWASISPETLKAVLDRAKGQGQAGSTAASLAQAPGFVAAMARAQAGHPAVLSAYLNAAAAFDRFARPDMGPNEEQAFQLLGGADLKTLSFAMTVDGAGLVSRLCLSAPVAGPRRGLLGVVQQGAADRGLAALAPASSTGVAISKLDLAASWDRALALIAGLEPRARKDADRGIGEIDRRLGASLRADLLASLGEDAIAATFPTPGGGMSGVVLALRLRDAKRFEAFMGAVSRHLAAPLRERALGGRRVRYLLAPAGRLGQNPFRALDRDETAQTAFFALGVLGQAWTIEDGVLYVARTPQALADYFDRLHAEGAITKNHAFAAALQKAPAGAQLLVYADPTHGFAGNYGLLLNLSKFLESTARAAGVPIDVNLLPRAEALARHLSAGVDSVTLDGGGLVLESRGSTGLDLVPALPTVGVVAIVAAIAIPNLLESRKGANESAAISSLRTLVTAQALYRDADKDGDGKANFAASLRDLERNGHLIDPVLASGVKQGYRFTMRATDGDFGFEATATPISQKTGTRFFFVDESGVIRFERGRPPRPTSPPIGG